MGGHPVNHAIAPNLSTERHGAGEVRFQPGDDSQQRCFAGTGSTHNAQRFVEVDAEIEIQSKAGAL